MKKLVWEKGNCQICGKEIDQLEGEKLVTCGKFDCLRKANERGLFTKPVQPAGK